MNENERLLVDQKFLEDISEIIAQAKKNAKTAVNLTMVYAYYEIGRRIVEKGQQGKSRAAYGTQLLKVLSEYLTEEYGKGYSAENLKLMRRFYVVCRWRQCGNPLYT